MKSWDVIFAKKGEKGGKTITKTAFCERNSAQTKTL